MLMVWLAGTPPASAGPWVKKPGEAYIKVSGSMMFGSDEIFDADGHLRDAQYANSHESVRGYAELGVMPGLAVKVSAPFLASTNELNGRTRYTRSGFGDLDVAAQISLVDGHCPVSVAPAVRLPLYEGTVGATDSVNTVGQGSAGVARYTPALGDGSVDLSASVAFGCSLYPVPGWLRLQVGPRVRLDGFGDTVDYGLGGGLVVWDDHLAVTARLAGVKRLSTDNQRPTKRYLSVGGSVLVRIYGGFALEATASYIPFGAFVARGWAATAGISFTGEVFSNPYD